MLSVLNLEVAGNSSSEEARFWPFVQKLVKVATSTSDSGNSRCVVFQTAYKVVLWRCVASIYAARRWNLESFWESALKLLGSIVRERHVEDPTLSLLLGRGFLACYSSSLAQWVISKQMSGKVTRLVDSPHTMHIACTVGSPLTFSEFDDDELGC